VGLDFRDAAACCRAIRRGARLERRGVLRAGDWDTDEGVAIGFSRKGELVRVPIASARSVMALIVGATGSGKTILMLLLALAAIKRGQGVILIDPKGDDFVLEQLYEAAAPAGVRPLNWEPLGDLVYNPF